jgi:hypothetical protein
VGCPVTLAFAAGGEADLLEARVRWTIRRVMPGGRSFVDRWYAVLPIAEQVPPPRTHGLIALQLGPQTEGTYDYAVEVEDVHGLRSNVLHVTVIVDDRRREVPCPPADPTPPAAQSVEAEPRPV